MPPGVLPTVLGCAGFLLGQNLVGCRASPLGAIGWDVCLLAMGFQGCQEAASGRQCFHTKATRKSPPAPCHSPGKCNYPGKCPSPGPQHFKGEIFFVHHIIFSKNSACGGQISGVYCGFSPYIAVKTIPVLGGRSLRVQGIHTHFIWSISI